MTIHIAPDFTEAFDTMSLRLEQIEGLVWALMANYSQQELGSMRHVLCPEPMLNALGGIVSLIEEAKQARDVLTDCQFTARAAGKA